MSGLKSATLTPFGKSDKRSNKSPRKTYRFGFTLSDPSEDSCSVFDYGSEVKLKERKAIKKLREEREIKANGSLNPFNDDDENDEDVRRLARKFEEKYGEKKGRSKSYAELGAGYDENDPFIDNTEAQDEELEEDQETPCGGYYINSGPLELKKVDVSDHSDLEDVGRRKHKRVMSAIEEDDEEREQDELDEEEEEDDGEGEEERKEQDNEVNGETNLEPEEMVTDSKKENNFDEKDEELNEKSPEISEDSEEPIKKKRKRLVSEDLNQGASVIKPKKVKTVKTLLEEKRVHEVQSSVPEEPNRHRFSTSINEAIESVINAGNHNENSNSSNSSKSGVTSSEDSQEGKPSSQNQPPPLPDNLPADLLTLVENIRHTAAITDNTRKTFCPDINSNLIKLEWKSRDFSTSNRNLLFAHLAFYLPCTKDTLMRRAKKLFLLKEENEIETVICKLKATIDAKMPSLEEKYEKEHQRIMEEQRISASPSNGMVHGGETMKSPDCVTGKSPKRKFPWTEEIRGYLKEIIRLKKRCYKVLKTRRSNYEEYITHFITSKVRVLWPHGWMKTSTLLRECNLSPHSGKQRHSSSLSKDDPERLNTSYPGQVSMPPATYNGTDPLNLLSKITTSISAPKSPKAEKPESFSMDSLLKRTSEISNCHDYKTTLSDIMKQDGVLMNGSSLPVDIGRSEKVLDLSSCNSSVSGGTPSVIQSVASNDRTAMRASDSVSLNTSTTYSHSTPVICKKESSPAETKKTIKEQERRMSEETTTATDILSQIISESLKAPSTMGSEEKNNDSPASKEQELLFDVMQDLRELNHMSSKQDYKKNSYSGWPQANNKPVEKKPINSSYHKEFLKHVFLAQENPSGLTTPSPYSRHTVSPYENSPYMNDSSNSVYNSSSHRSAQNITPHGGSASAKVPQMNQSCGMNPSTGIPSGNPQRYPMEYPSNDQHVVGLPSSLPFGMHNWFPGSESQSHQ